MTLAACAWAGQVAFEFLGATPFFDFSFDSFDSFDSFPEPDAHDDAISISTLICICSIARCFALVTRCALKKQIARNNQPLESSLIRTMAPSNGVAGSGGVTAKSNGVHRKSNGTNGSSSTQTRTHNPKTQNSSNGMPSIISTLGTILRFLFVDIPLTSLFLLLVTSILIQHSYHTYVKVYLQAYRRQPPYDDHAREGFFPDFDYDMTYYNRQCDKYDITTKDANDLLVQPNATGEDAADIMMKHGAVVVQSVLRQDTAIELRKYLESRHHIQEELP